MSPRGTREGAPQVISFSAVVGQRGRRLTRAFPLPPPPSEYVRGFDDGRRLRAVAVALLVGVGAVIGAALAVWIGVGGGAP